MTQPDTIVRDTLQMTPSTDIHNLTIIAHLDSSKTTFADGMLKRDNLFQEHQQLTEPVLDSSGLERQYSITILVNDISVDLVPLFMPTSLHSRKRESRYRLHYRSEKNDKKEE